MINLEQNKEELDEKEILIIKYIYQNNGCTCSELIENFNTNIYGITNLINNMLITKILDKFILTGKGKLFISQYFFNKKVTLSTLNF